MSWLWPPSWFRGKQQLPVPPECGHKELACEFFWLNKIEQRKFLYYLSVSSKEQVILLNAAEPFRDVKSLMAILKVPEKPMTAEMYLGRLKAVHLDGRDYHVVAVLQNIFRDKAEATHYAGKVLAWEG